MSMKLCYDITKSMNFTYDKEAFLTYNKNTHKFNHIGYGLYKVEEPFVIKAKDLVDNNTEVSLLCEIIYSLDAETYRKTSYSNINKNTMLKVLYAFNSTWTNITDKHIGDAEALVEILGDIGEDLEQTDDTLTIQTGGINIITNPINGTGFIINSTYGNYVLANSINMASSNTAFVPNNIDTEPIGEAGYINFNGSIGYLMEQSEPEGEEITETEKTSTSNCVIDYYAVSKDYSAVYYFPNNKNKVAQINRNKAFDGHVAIISRKDNLYSSMEQMQIEYLAVNREGIERLEKIYNVLGDKNLELIKLYENDNKKKEQYNNYTPSKNAMKRLETFKLMYNIPSVAKSLFSLVNSDLDYKLNATIKYKLVNSDEMVVLEDCEFFYYMNRVVYIHQIRIQDEKLINKETRLLIPAIVSLYVIMDLKSTYDNVEYPYAIEIINKDRAEVLHNLLSIEYKDSNFISVSEIEV